MQDEKKEGKGLIRQGNGVRWVLAFVNDIPEGDVIEMNEVGKELLRGRMKAEKETGGWVKLDSNEKEREYCMKKGECV